MVKAHALKTALLIVDVQNDFLPGGALGISHGDQIIPVINQIQPYFSHVIATQDWHPSNHISFASAHGKKPGDHIALKYGDQTLWPDHCIQESWGAQFAPSLQTESIEKVFFKGVDREIDSYSAFYDNAHQRSTGLSTYLKEIGISHLYIVGLTTEYCIKFSALDALKLGLHLTVILDGCFGINLKNGDIERALEEIQKQGGLLITSALFFDQISQS